MKTSKKVLLAVAFVIFFLSLGFFGKMLYNKAIKSKGNDYEFSKYFTSKTNLVRLKNNKYCLLSKENKKFISPELDLIFEMYSEDSLTVFVLKNKRGYINGYTGKVVIPADTFQYAWQFDTETGLAAVVVNNKMGFINKKGNFVIQPDFVYNRDKYYWDYFIFSRGYCIIPDAGSGKFGLINKHGEVILEPRYDFISNSMNTYNYYQRIIENDKVGITDSAYNIVISPAYDSADPTAIGFILRKGEDRVLVDLDSRTVKCRYIFENAEAIETYYNVLGYEYYTTDICTADSSYLVFSMYESKGVFDMTRKKVCIEPIWDNVYYLCPDVFVASLEEYYFLLDASGKFILK